VTGSSVTFTVPPPADIVTAATGYMEIRLTATDDAGMSRTVVRQLRPTWFRVRIATAPPDLMIRVNGREVAGLVSFRSWADYPLTVEAPTQVIDGETWALATWSDGGAATHTIEQPSPTGIYLATFKRERGKKGG
jgi:hypothetical protein